MIEYELHAIRYARNMTRTSDQNFMDDDLHAAPMPMHFYVWTIVGGGRSFVLDTGFDAAAATARGRTLDRPVAAGLEAVGIAAATVQDVIISHMHWDHAGNDGLFPAARYHLQDTEMAYCTGRCMCHGPLRAPFNVGDVQQMIGRVYSGHACFHDGTAELAPGLSVHLLGGHSKGLQCVRVHTRRGWMVLASDVSHYYANFEQGRVFPITYNLGDVLEGYRIMHELADSPAHIIPGHDPLVEARYPAARAGLEGVVRLDAEPK